LLGVPFVLVEHVAGHTISSELPAELRSGKEARQVGERLVAALADIHAVQVSSGELAHIGRPSGYLERQLRRFATIWAQVKTRELAAMDHLTAWLAEHRPTTAETTLVHGDFRLGNVLFAPEGPPRIAAVLDWEMATLGDPLADLGYLCATWARPGDDENPMLALSAVTRFEGFLTPDGLRQQYALRSGRNVDDLRWYEVLALWKAAVFLESSYRRYCDGTTRRSVFRRAEGRRPAAGGGRLSTNASYVVIAAQPQTSGIQLDRVVLSRAAHRLDATRKTQVGAYVSCIGPDE
jgi:aminoglycoside phosphotransferase (APT) family kinase protein